MMLTEFSKGVSEQIGYYVYRLIDPRDGQTFYVGKGRGNRLFDHINFAYSAGNINPLFSHDENKESLKLARIHQIKDAGLDVVHVIQRWGLTEKEAFLVESVLIDTYGFDSLSNLVKGQDQEHGVCNAETLERDLSSTFFDEGPDIPPFMIIKTKQWHVDDVGRYEATRRAWRIKLERASKFKIVLSVTGGIVREVYQVDKWKPSSEYTKRIEFVGKVADEPTRSIFINKKIPKRFMRQGMASATLYSDSK